MTGVPGAERGQSGVQSPALRTGAYAFGLASLVCATLLGIYTATATLPDCAGFYTCTRVTDRTILLGSTATATSLGVLVVLALLRITHARAPAWLPRVLRVILVLGAAGLLACYQLTQFPTLRSAMTAVMAASPPMWTASWALWLTVTGLLATATGITDTITPPRPIRQSDVG